MELTKEIVYVAYGAMKTRNTSPKKAAESVAKAFKLSDADKELMETCLIEYAMGISDINDRPTRTMGPSELLEIHRKAVLAGDGCAEFGGFECDGRLATKAIERFIANALAYKL